MSELKLDLQPVTASTSPAETPDPTPEVPAASAGGVEPSAPTPLRPATAAARPRRAATRRTTEPSSTRTPDKPEVDPTTVPVQGPWRKWERSWETRSYRLPPELIDELTERLWQLRVRDVGVPIAAAITHMLDLDDDALLALVERADSAKPRRRAAGRPPRAGAA